MRLLISVAVLAAVFVSACSSAGERPRVEYGLRGEIDRPAGRRSHGAASGDRDGGPPGSDRRRPTDASREARCC